MQFGRGLVGGSVGGILGIAVGVWVGVLLVAILFLVAYPPLVTSDSLRAEETVQIILNSSIYPLGILGIGFGVLEGFGQIHVRQMGDRFLINAVIYSAMISALFRKLLRIPPVSRWWQRMHPTSVESKPTLAITRPTSHHPFDRLPEFSSDGADAFEINRQGDILTLRRRTYRTSDWVWMGFNGLYNLLALLVGAIALLRGTWVMMGFGINILLVLAAVWTWHSLTQLINYTTITLNPKSLSRRDTPLVSSAVSLRVPLYQIAEVKALMPSNPPLSYHVCLVLTNGRQLILLKNLDRQEEATFLESQINRFLRDRW
ncbi:MAG: hypothetical protein HC769_31880 [Cyanobacteria bacterium CRU_2_1]|nr:hypothetical protein [Cyanobacteria bacterium CRU_2_1]